MEYISLSNGLQLPKIGLGVWNTYAGEAEQTVESALRLGYRRIDTAMAYKNEVEVGRGIKNSGATTIPKSVYEMDANWHPFLLLKTLKPLFSHFVFGLHGFMLFCKRLM